MKTPLEVFDGNGPVEILDADGIPIAHVYHRGRAGGKNYVIDGKANAAQIVDAVNAAHRDDELAKALMRAEQTLRNLGQGDLSGDAKNIAYNEATNIRTALYALSAPHKKD